MLKNENHNNLPCHIQEVVIKVFLIILFNRFRKRRSLSDGCGCKDSHDNSKQMMELTSSSTSGGQIGVINGSREVYDNPNYSHIMIGGQPFFILPSGELSDHVPVPVQADQLTPRKMTLSSGQHIYEGGSSTYRSTSDYDTDSSTYRPDSDRTSNGHQQPIYEEIDKELEARGQAVSPINTVAVVNNISHPMSVHTRLERPQHPWSTSTPRATSSSPPWSASTHKSLSPRRPVTGAGSSKKAANSGIYYYSDTLRFKKGERDLTESDSGISSESTPHHVANTPYHVINTPLHVANTPLHMANTSQHQVNTPLHMSQLADNASNHHQEHLHLQRRGSKLRGRSSDMVSDTSFSLANSPGVQIERPLEACSPPVHTQVYLTNMNAREKLNIAKL